MASKRKQGYQVNYSMSARTKTFLQKICQKDTASVDMTRYGFVKDNHPIQLFIEPLRMQLEKIHGQNIPANDSKQAPVKRLKFTEKGSTEPYQKSIKKNNVNIKTRRLKTPSNNANVKKSNNL